MNRIPITTACRPCLGMLCPMRASCDHYAAVERSQTGDPSTIATCVQPDQERPMYLPLTWIEREAVAA